MANIEPQKCVPTQLRLSMRSRGSTTTRRKSGAISRTRMPIARNGGHRPKSQRIVRGPTAIFDRYPWLIVLLLSHQFYGDRFYPGLVTFHQDGAALPAADAERSHAA